MSQADVVKFNKDRCHTILKSKFFNPRKFSGVLTFTPDRGPAEGTLSRADDLADFIRLFCIDMALFIDPSRELRYEPRDVDWWWANVFPGHQEARVLDIFIKVHRKVSCVCPKRPLLPADQEANS